MPDKLKFYKPFDRNDFNNKRCFLCGEDLNEENSSFEHILPKWLLRKFDLWDKSLIMINQTSVKYNQFKIPCCKNCNNEHLSKMEEKFKRLLENKFQKLTPDDEKIIFQWTAKILYGSVYRKLSFRIDMKNPELGNLMTPEIIESYSALHLFLQSIRFPTKFHEPYPWSFFIFQFEDDTFHYINDFENLSFSIKLGKIGIVIVFEDSKKVENSMVLMKGLYQFPLDFVQYLEVTMLIFYSKMLIQSTPKYISVISDETKEMEVFTIPSIFQIPLKKFDNGEFAALFENLLKSNIGIINTPLYQDGFNKTFLVDEDNVLYINKIKNLSKL